MIKDIPRLTCILIIFILMISGCEKEINNIDQKITLEISPDSKNNIEFEFCLLNEDGAAKNGMEDSISVTTEFINSDFYRVFQYQDNKDLGKPWTGVWCEFSLTPQEIKLAPSESKKLECPWVLVDGNTSNIRSALVEAKNFYQNEITILLIIWIFIIRLMEKI